MGANKKARREVRAWTRELLGGEKPAVAEEVSAVEAAAARIFGDTFTWIFGMDRSETWLPWSILG